MNIYPSECQEDNNIRFKNRCVLCGLPEIWHKNGKILHGFEPEKREQNEAVTPGEAPSDASYVTEVHPTDLPSCHCCGAMMVPTGYKCLSCKAGEVPSAEPLLVCHKCSQKHAVVYQICPECYAVLAQQVKESERQLAEALEALKESVKLQSHYALLLNGWDGGDRIIFKSAEEWLTRLKSLRRVEEKLPTTSDSAQH